MTEAKLTAKMLDEYEKDVQRAYPHATTWFTDEILPLIAAAREAVAAREAREQSHDDMLDALAYGQRCAPPPSTVEGDASGTLNVCGTIYADHSSPSERDIRQSPLPSNDIAEGTVSVELLNSERRVADSLRAEAARSKAERDAAVEDNRRQSKEIERLRGALDSSQMLIELLADGPESQAVLRQIAAALQPKGTE